MQPQQLMSYGISATAADGLAAKINLYISTLSPEKCWQKLSKETLPRRKMFELHKFLYQTVYPDWHHKPAPAWIPATEDIISANITKTLTEKNFENYQALHQWSITEFDQFWSYTIDKLNIQFHTPYKNICDLKDGYEKPYWLSGSKLNIIESCFNADKKSHAIIFQQENGKINKFTYEELDKLSNRIANSLVKQQFKPGDAIAIDMPMNINAVAIYLGIIKAGCVVVSIADSFAPDEIATRLKIAKAKAIFTQDFMIRAQKKLALYEKVIAAQAPMAIVIPCEKELTVSLRNKDLSWEKFLVEEDVFQAVSCDPDHPCNILFSSGTTGEPKAIVWSHTTPIKCASDAYYHLDIKSGEVIALPTNLGWMMGPWLIYAGLINRATIALFDGAPTGREYGEFIQNSRADYLGVVPSLVATWRTTKCMEDIDWSHIKLYFSTGECSNHDDMLYLMWLANYSPIIEYCGGTEIGGAYITSTVLEPNVPALFTTSTLGLDFIIIDENGNPANNGEVALVPPSIGLSNQLLNRDHHQVYFENMPKYQDKILRRHGDQIEKVDDHYYRAEGRVDDTMNLGGIKVSSAEIERVLVPINSVKETAAVAINPPLGGPSLLVIFAVLNDKKDIDKNALLQNMQSIIKEHLNPLFKIHDVIILDDLPRTASNKIMRRVLRDKYQSNSN